MKLPIQLIITIISLQSLPLLNALVIDTSNYLPYPPEDNPSQIKSTNELNPYPYTDQYTKIFSNELIECMKQIEESQLTKNCEFNYGQLVCNCHFIDLIQRGCKNGTNDVNYWYLENANAELKCNKEEIDKVIKGEKG